jgi:hypothetical protein
MFSPWCRKKIITWNGSHRTLQGISLLPNELRIEFCRRGKGSTSISFFFVEKNLQWISITQNNNCYKNDISFWPWKAMPQEIYNKDQNPVCAGKKLVEQRKLSNLKLSTNRINSRWRQNRHPNWFVRELSDRSSELRRTWLQRCKECQWTIEGELYDS